MSNYPPGVTGNEWDIVGPDSETDEDRDVECWDPECGFKGTVEGVRVTYQREAWFDWECPACGRNAQEDLPED